MRNLFLGTTHFRPRQPTADSLASAVLWRLDGVGTTSKIVWKTTEAEAYIGAREIVAKIVDVP
jgi:hypothetical protein